MAKPLIPVDAVFDRERQLLDEYGAEGLSARNLAASLKCSTRTLYEQVGKRDELIGQLFAHYFAGLQVEFHHHPRWKIRPLAGGVFPLIRLSLSSVIRTETRSNYRNDRLLLRAN